MIKVLGKLFRRDERLSDFRHIMTTEDIPFNGSIQNIDCIIFDSNTILEDGTWYYIQNFKDNEFCLNIIKEKISTASYEAFKDNQLDNLHFILFDDDENVYIQKTTPSWIIRKRALQMSNDKPGIISTKLILIKDIPDAIYSRIEDRLYFRKLNTLTTIFKGIEKIYREATKEEMEEFIGLEMIEFEEGYDISEVKSLNRKRILSVLQELKDYSKEELSELKIYASKYNDDIAFEDEKFRISNEDQMKRVLYGLQERYYDTEVTKRRRLANSVININSNITP